MTFGEKLKILRIGEEYSQEQLAELLHVSRQAVTKWESGTGMPDIENLKAVADLFGVTLDSLVRDEEELETADEHFCWNLAWGFGIIGMVLGCLLRQLVPDSGIAGWAVGGGVIGYTIGWLMLQMRQKSQNRTQQPLSGFCQKGGHDEF